MAQAKKPKPNAKAINAAVQARRTRVSESILDGLTYREMSKLFKVCPATIGKDVKAIMAEWRTERIEAVGDMISVQHRLLDEIQKVLRPLVTIGGTALQVIQNTKEGEEPEIILLPHLGAIDRMLALQDRRMKLYGLDSKAMMEHIKEFLEEHDPERLGAESESIAQGLRDLEAIVERHGGRRVSRKTDPGDSKSPTLN